MSGICPRRSTDTPALPHYQLAIWILIFFLILAAPAAAQQTRSGELAAKQAEKAGTLHPPEPDALERRIRTADAAARLFAAPVYPFVGQTFEGGGFALGPGYRGRFLDTGAFDLHAAWSVKNYKSAEAALQLPAIVDNRVTVEMRASWLDAPEVAFYGTGDGSNADLGTGFFYRTRSVGVTGRLRAATHVSVGGGVDAIETETGASDADSTMANLAPSYRRTRVFAEFDSRTSPGYTRRGGLYRVEWSNYDQTDAGALSFRRVDAEVQQFFPILREHSVIALRGLASTTSAGSGRSVPYFLLPDLGGHHWLRGYPSWRFRDRDRLLVTGEYRWTAGRFVDMAVFMDAGQVAGQLEDFNWGEFRRTYGVGLSLHTLTSTVTRIELVRAAGANGVVLSFTPSF
jgi:hypothetical protein